MESWNGAIRMRCLTSGVPATGALILAARVCSEFPS